MKTYRSSEGTAPLINQRTSWRWVFGFNSSSASVENMVSS